MRLSRRAERAAAAFRDRRAAEMTSQQMGVSDFLLRGAVPTAAARLSPAGPPVERADEQQLQETGSSETAESCRTEPLQ